MTMKAKAFFTQEWGTGFTKATLSEKNGVLEMSIDDIYYTMEKFAELRLSNVMQQHELLKAFADYHNKNFEYENICDDGINDFLNSL